MQSEEGKKSRLAFGKKIGKLFLCAVAFTADILFTFHNGFEKRLFLLSLSSFVQIDIRLVFGRCNAYTLCGTVQHMSIRGNCILGRTNTILIFFYQLPLFFTPS